MTDSIAVARWRGQELAPLLLAYHLRTEVEKGVPVSDVDGLSARYRAEVLDPVTAFFADVVFVAESGAGAVGCVVACAPAEDSLEMKRLWVDPDHRGKGAARLLVNAVIAHAGRLGVPSVRLSVWEWRQDAIALYERLGFTRVESWDPRPGLVCMSCS